MADPIAAAAQPHDPSAVILTVGEPSVVAEVRRQGYAEVAHVEDAAGAVDAALERRPDVVLLDLDLPDGVGLELLASLHGHSRLARVPVVVIAADAETRREAFELGATDFLAKPLDPHELSVRLHNTLSLKAHLDRLTYTDALTGLPNRRRFAEHLTDLLGRPNRGHAPAAVLQLQAGGTEELDALGDRGQEELARLVAGRIQDALYAGIDGARQPEGQMLACAEHDQFLLLLDGADAERAGRTARQLLLELEEPLRIVGEDFFVPARVGITLFPDDGDDAETLLGNAEGALLQADARPGGSIHFHDESLNTDSRDRLILEGHLREALRSGELQLHYQPKVDLLSGEVVGAEALARWENPVLGSVPPDRFIPIAEESGLIEALGEWAIRRACWQMRAWLDVGLPPIFVSVNVSSRQLRSGQLESIIESALDEHRLEGHHLMLELTESMIMESPEEIGVILNGLKRLGVSISVDDFGTGYSSLSTLQRFPIDELKIDRSFVKGIPDDPDDCAIVAAVIAIGHALGVGLVAEGVEQEAQAAFLRERGCEVYQGFLCSRPLAAADWPMLLTRLGS